MAKRYLTARALMNGIDRATEKTIKRLAQIDGYEEACQRGYRGSIQGFIKNPKYRKQIEAHVERVRKENED